MNVPAAVREWLASLSAADSEEIPEPVGKGEDPTTEPDAETDPAAPEGDPAAPEGDPAAPEVDPAATVDENTDTTGDGGDRTAPEPVSPLTDSERDAMNTLAGENEALRQENADLRNRIAELGGDAALGIVEEEVVEEITDEPEDEYDADADLAEQEAELARLRGE